MRRRTPTLEESTLKPAPTRALAADRQLCVTIVYHPDVSRIGERTILEGSEHEIARAKPAFGSGAPIGDRYISRAPVRIVRGTDGITLEAAEGARAIADGRPIGPTAGWHRYGFDAAERGIVIELADRVVLLLHSTAARGSSATRGLVGESDAIHRLRDDIARVADLDVPVLLRGETGTGKELAARAIHDARGGDKPFVAVNVAALPPTTAASELFGHSRGAFTGASHEHEGLFVRADGGTLFLDEIGETPFDVQPMLLRVLETSEVTPLGSARARPVRVRLIAATDADLETQIAESGFRSALFHRLAGYQIFLPPLRERRDDIGRLLIHFLRSELAATGDLARLEGQRDAAQLWLPASIVARLARYNWPGNVRQLRNAARQLAIGNRGAAVVAIDAALERLLATVAVTPPPEPTTAEERKSRRDPSQITDDELLGALRANGWRANAAATQLGVSRSTLYNLIEKSRRIRKAKDIPVEELERTLASCGGDLDLAAAELEVSRRALKLRLGELELD